MKYLEIAPALLKQIEEREEWLSNESIKNIYEAIDRAYKVARDEIQEQTLKEVLRSWLLQ